MLLLPRIPDGVSPLCHASEVALACGKWRFALQRIPPKTDPFYNETVRHAAWQTTRHEIENASLPPDFAKFCSSFELIALLLVNLPIYHTEHQTALAPGDTQGNQNDECEHGQRAQS